MATNTVPPRTSREEVYQAIDSERNYQEAMAEKAHGDPSNDGTKHLEEFVLYMEDYLHEARTQLSRTWGPTAYDDATATIRKVVAIGVSALEVWGVQKRGAPTKHARGTDITDQK